MALVVNINGTEHGIRSLSLGATLNGKDSITLELDSLDGSVQPDFDEPLTVVEDSAMLFGGSIKRPAITGKGDALAAITNKIFAIDFNELADRDMIFGMTIAAGTTTRAALQQILDGGYLPGVTNGMPSSPDTSPVINETLVWDEVYVSAALDELSVHSGWLKEINGNKVAQFFAPGSRAAPWNVADGDGNTYGNITVTRSRLQYYNRWVIKFTAAATAAYAFLTMSGNFTDGSTVEVGGRTYTMKTSPSAANEVQIGASTTDSLNNLISAILDGVGGGVVHATVGAYLQHSTMMAARALTPGASGNNIAVATNDPAAAWVTEGGGGTVTLLLGTDEGLTNRAIVNDLAQQALFGVYTGLAEAATTRTLEDAQALGQLMLNTSIVVVATVEYKTRRSGLFPGMTQTIQAAKRFLNNACLITEISHSMMNEGSLMDRKVTAIFNVVSGAGDTYRSTPWRDRYKLWNSGGRSAAVAIGGGSGGGGGSLASKRVYLLQGSANVWAQGTGGVWYPADGSAEGGAEYLLDPTELGTTVGTVFVRLRAVSGNVTARLRNLTAGSTAGTSAVITSTSFVTVSFPVSFVYGVHRLELSPSVSGLNGRVGGVGYLEC